MGNPFYPAYDPDRGRWSDDRLALTEPAVLVDVYGWKLGTTGQTVGSGRVGGGGGKNA